MLGALKVATTDQIQRIGAPHLTFRHADKEIPSKQKQARTASHTAALSDMRGHGLSENGGSTKTGDTLRNLTPTVQGTPIDPTNLTRTFTTLLRKAGLRRIRFHDLRHSTATLLLEQGVELVVIKELLGHAHIGVTATVYAHVRLRLQRDAIDTLGRALDHP
ncbi:tyrosine-type recombinase/integrase [Streptomyces sp. NPDC048577]|uniref:tyrosine-type recombinase/integrase n=1 Tax=Streptomyces sp. NPDC048577 TaxID=3157209 RepID=UPI00342E3A19